MTIYGKTLISLSLLALAFTAAHADKSKPNHVRFVVVGDDRLRFPGEGGPRKGYDNVKSGIDEGVFGPMLRDALRRRPDFVLVTGDLVAGEDKKTPGLPDLESQLKAWVKFVKASNPGGVPVFAVRGNHETKAKKPDPAWASVAKLNGRSASVTSKFWTDGFNIGFNYGNVTVVGLDCYTKGKRNVADLKFANNVLAKRKKNVFAFSHPMCFFSGGHPDHLDKKNRDEFLNALVKSGCGYFFAGHDHLYDRVTIGRSDNKWHGATIQQYVAGTSGAPFYLGDPLPFSDAAEDGGRYTLDRSPSDHVEFQFGYLVVDVDGDKTTVTPVFFSVPGLKDPKSMRAKH